MSFLIPSRPEGRMVPLHRDSEDGLSPLRSPVANQHSRANPSISSTAGAEALTASAVEPPPSRSVPRRRIVFPDPVAFRYLEEDACVDVVERRGSLRGYELYLVEQWACSRQSPTLVIVTYTGDERHSVVVGVLSVPVDESLWSTNLRAYFKASRQYLARPKETDLGELMVTNLSSFPSALTVIPVPGGDIRKHRQIFVVNENLKRMGCSGRSGLTLAEPAEGTKSKFRSLYRVSDRVPVHKAVTELVKLCQVALYMFEKLELEYIDGLLCDVTEKAIGNWWTQVGAEHYNYEPNDGILGPTTVAALLGMLMGARNRLYWCGAPVPKDVFDVENTKRGISHFQKLFKLEKTRRLDRPTLLKLYHNTAKAATSEGWGVPKAVKSRMTEIGGMRGEIVMGMVSGKDKGGLADVETLDLERFISFAYGERAKWLWYGKPRRSGAELSERAADGVNPSFGESEGNDQPIFRTQTLPVEDDPEMKRKDELQATDSEITPGLASALGDSSADKDAARRNVLKSVAGKMSDARSGLGRIKDAVGGSRRGHSARPSISTRDDVVGHRNGSIVLSGSVDSSGMATSPSLAAPGRAFTWKNKPEEYLAAMKRGEPLVPTYDVPTELRESATADLDSGLDRKIDTEKETIDIGPEIRKDIPTAAPSTADSAINETMLEGPVLNAERTREMPNLGLTRRHSLEEAQLSLKQVFNEDRWPRRMSFSDAEEAVLTWDEIIEVEETAEDLAELLALAEHARHLQHGIDDIIYKVEPWVEEKLSMVALLDDRYARDKEDLQNMYQQLNEACQRVRYNSEELLAEERASLTESVKEIEVLVARLEYEINALFQKVADVEEGIQNFERQVQDVERRAADLKAQLETESWLHWFVRTLTGVGTGPNITRAES